MKGAAVRTRGLLKSQTIRLFVAIATFTLASVMASAATTDAIAWTINDRHGITLPTVTTNGSSIKVSFKDPGFPFAADAVVAPVAGMNASFTGDYSRAGIQVANFTVVATNSPATNSPIAAIIQLYGRTGRIWATFAVSNGNNSVSFNRSQGVWTLIDGDTGADLDIQWSDDQHNVAGLELKIQRNASVSAFQTVAISNFYLLGSQTVGSAPMTLENALMQAFGTNNVADIAPEIANDDDDGDGMSNLDEVLAMYQDGYFDETLFKASFGVGGVTIRFACLNGNTYSVERATNAVSGVYAEIGSVTATNGPGYTATNGTGYAEYQDSAPGDGPNFYRVVQQ